MKDPNLTNAFEWHRSLDSCGAERLKSHCFKSAALKLTQKLGHNVKMSAQPEPRNVDIDFLKGIGLLGILLINIRAFSTYGISMINPSAASVPGWNLNHIAWSVVTLIAQTKSMDLFVIIMGASFYEFYRRAHLLSARPYLQILRRYTMLLAIGVLHVLVFWHGDVLVLYALGVIVLYPLLRARAGMLLFGGFLIYFSAVFFGIKAGRDLLIHPLKLQWITDGIWQPTAVAQTYEANIFRASFFKYLMGRIDFVERMQLYVYPTLIVPQFVGAFLLGFGSRGLFSKPHTGKWLRRVVQVLLGVGIILCSFGLFENEKHKWSAGYSLHFGFQWNYVGSLFIAYGFCFLWRAPSNWAHSRLYSWIGCAGRMSLSNYFFQSVFSGFIFYGWGLGFFGQFQYVTVVAIALGLWAFQVGVSSWWLRNFRFGPLEFLLRKAAYGRPSNLGAQLQ